MNPVELKIVYFRSGNQIEVGVEDKEKNSKVLNIRLIPVLGCVMLHIGKGEKTFKTLHPLNSIDSMEML